ncbi:MAG: phosphate ABC transporter substrate-binding protein [Actinobacteria bacterium]|nr:phosphate ABC transporter substrate-binding protein [Planctomycetota bacterium]MBU4391066.1 phosphate ABC transporter substrate-binding protein [Actinomycetota bacterium]MBU4401511.1 phosphate ABC transporter substrate-binding protein [Actinomycetota bacterium]MBU4441296.1 phosphate ABC transporter substrate-binding protein [Actinomycetota bacterium]MCG2818278.1 phosphate ABC transporter substrate-binding protein [Actinomycetes bacterium]
MRKNCTRNGLLVGVVILALLLVMLAVGCGNGETEESTTPAKTEGEYSGTVKASGSTTVLPLAQEAATGFMEDNPDATVEVQGGGSSTGITQVKEGVVDIGNASRDLKDEEDDGALVDHKIAFDIIAVVVNPGVTVTDLTTDQVKGLFTGAIKNWSEVGGADAEVVVVSRDQASGTREMFDQEALGSSKDAPVVPAESAIETNSNGIMRETVASTANSIGYLSYGYINDSVKPVNYNGVEPTIENAKADTYPLARYLHMFTNGEPEGAVKGYIDYVLSDAFQTDVVSKDYIPISEVE